MVPLSLAQTAASVASATVAGELKAAVRELVVAETQRDALRATLEQLGADYKNLDVEKKRVEGELAQLREDLKKAKTSEHARDIYSKEQREVVIKWILAQGELRVARGVLQGAITGCGGVFEKVEAADLEDLDKDVRAKLYLWAIQQSAGMIPAGDAGIAVTNLKKKIKERLKMEVEKAKQ